MIAEATAEANSSRVMVLLISGSLPSAMLGNAKNERRVVRSLLEARD